MVPPSEATATDVLQSILCIIYSLALPSKESDIGAATVLGMCAMAFIRPGRLHARDEPSPVERPASMAML